jgi:hypothetical protein
MGLEMTLPHFASSLPPNACIVLWLHAGHDRHGGRGDWGVKIARIDVYLPIRTVVYASVPS